MADSWFEVAFGAHYPEIYGHRDQAEADRCLELLPTLAPLNFQGKPLLDLGCGDGRHLAGFKTGGYDAIGLDLSSALLALASHRPECGPLVRGDMRFLPFHDHNFASVLSLFTAFGYFGALKENLPMVREVTRVLAPGGHWFLDYFNCDAVKNELGSEEKFHRERVVGNLQILETRQYSSARSVVSKDVQLKSTAGTEFSGLPGGGLSYTEQVAVFSLEEMDELAGSQGLRRVAEAGSYQGAPLNDGDRWILVYRKEDSLS